MRHLLHRYFFELDDYSKTVGIHTFAIQRLLPQGPKDRFFDAQDKNSTQEILATTQTAYDSMPKDFAAGVDARIFIKTHYQFSQSHPLVTQPGHAILIVRQPKDVLLSAINYLSMQKGEIDNPRLFVNRFIKNEGHLLFEKRGYGTWTQHASGWATSESTDRPVTVLTYEQLRKDPIKTMTALIQRIAGDVDSDRIARVVSDTELDKLRSQELKAKRETANDRLFFNKGQVGQTLSEVIDIDLDDRFDEAFAGPIDAVRSILESGDVDLIGDVCF